MKLRKQVIDAFHAFEIAGHRILENTEQNVTTDLRQRGVIRVGTAPFGMGLIAVTRSHDKDFFRAEMYGRTDGRQMAHRTVATPLSVSMNQHCLGGRSEERRVGK